VGNASLASSKREGRKSLLWCRSVFVCVDYDLEKRAFRRWKEKVNAGKRKQQGGGREKRKAITGKSV